MLCDVCRCPARREGCCCSRFAATTRLRSRTIKKRSGKLCTRNEVIGCILSMAYIAIILCNVSAKLLWLLFMEQSSQHKRLLMGCLQGTNSACDTLWRLYTFQHKYCIVSLHPCRHDWTNHDGTRHTQCPLRPRSTAQASTCRQCAYSCMSRESGMHCAAVAVVTITNVEAVQ